MPELNHFRTFEISQDGGGNAFELSRTDERVVCLAFDARFGCFCEIAALTHFPEDGAPTMDEFLEQAGTVAGLHHRGLASLLDYGDDQGVRFYAVEFIDGETVSDYARRVNGLPPALAFGLCADLADALSAISLLGLPIAAGKARVTLDDRGRLRVRIVDYPLGLLNAEGPRDTAAAVFELAHLLELLAAGEVIGEKSQAAEDVVDVAERIRRLNSVHDVAATLREAAGGGQFVAVDSRHRPKLLLAQKLFSRGSPEDFLSDDYRVEQASPAAADPYSISVVRISESRPLRMHVLPPAYILSDENLPIYETEKTAAVVGADALWRGEHFRLVSEKRFAGFSLTTLLRQAGELSDLEVMLLLDRVETAILEVRSAGAELARVHPDNVLIHFESRGFDDAEALMKLRPMTAWPEFLIILRAHQTMRGLTTLTPNAKQRFVQMRSALANDEPVNNLAVLELYLQLHDSGRAEQAEELLDRFEQSCKAAVAEAAAMVANDPAIESGLDVVSPIALQVAEGAPLGDEDDGDDGDGMEAELSPLGGGVLFGREQFEDDYIDGEFELGEAAGSVGEGAPVLSPIAAALGVASEEFEVDEVDEGDVGLSGTYFEDLDEPAVGLGSGLLGAAIVSADEDEASDEPISPFGLNPDQGEEEGDDSGLYPPDLEFDPESGDGGRGIVFFLILAGLAIGLAAVIAHVTGKAFWLR